MSLTGLLNDTKGPLRSFFRDRLGHLEGPRAEWNALGPVTLPSRTDRSWTGPVGAALDYRVRLAVETPEPEKLVAAAGADRLMSHLTDSLRREVPVSAASSLTESATDIWWVDDHTLSYVDQADALKCDFYAPIANRLSEMVPGTHGTRVNDEDSELARLCLVLALFEQCYRSPRVAQSPLATLAPGSTIDQIMALIPDDAAEDVVILWEAFASTSADLLDQPTICNPVFAHSRRVGGADGDIILGQTLIDLKASSQPGFQPKDLYQLIGYALLNDPAEYEIDSVAIYSARRPAMITWHLDDLVSALAGEPLTADELRGPFLEAADQSRGRGPRRTSNPS